MLVYLKDRSAQANLHTFTLRQKLQIKLSTSPSHSILTPGRPVPELTLQRQVLTLQRLADKPQKCQFLSHRYDSTWKNPVASRIQTRDLTLSRQMPLGQPGGIRIVKCIIKSGNGSGSQAFKYMPMQFCFCFVLFVGVFVTVLFCFSFVCLLACLFTCLSLFCFSTNAGSLPSIMS